MWLNVLKLIRWPNLVIVFITQWIVWSRLINASLHPFDLSSRLSFLYLVLLSLSTVLVAAAGYIINDIYDVNIDLINKPTKVLVSKVMSIHQCYFFYYLFLCFGFALALYLGFVFQELEFTLLFPLIAAFLHLYARFLKKTPLIGNIIISLFVAAVPFIPFLADANLVIEYANPRVIQLLLLYGGLAFLANLARELVKDMQDIQGDKAYGAKTFPVRYGLQRSKQLLYLILFLLFIILISWTFIKDISFQTYSSILLGTIPLLIVCTALILTLPSLKKASDFGKWSLGIKVFMLFGLVFLYLQTL